VEDILPPRDVVDRDDDVDDRLGGEARHRGRADVFDADGGGSERVAQPAFLFGEDRGPAIVVVDDLELAHFDASDEGRLFDVRSARHRLVGHLAIIAAVTRVADTRTIRPASPIRLPGP
jgi:hypothetical protein